MAGIAGKPTPFNKGAQGKPAKPGSKGTFRPGVSGDKHQAVQGHHNVQEKTIPAAVAANQKQPINGGSTGTPNGFAGKLGGGNVAAGGGSRDADSKSSDTMRYDPGTNTHRKMPAKQPKPGFGKAPKGGHLKSAKPRTDLKGSYHQVTG